MIGQISGILRVKNPPSVLVDTHGVGYEIDVPMSTFYDLPAIGAQVTLLTHFVVREDAQLLYGFLKSEEREAFRQLIRISGVGPRTALSLLSGLSITDLANAVSLQESGRLTKVPGIGKKTAERLLLELKGKFAPVLSEASATPLQDDAADVLRALISLGYSEKEALMACKSLPPGASVSDGIKHALRGLSK
jgi:holliday junction DNA helicase RuvA